MLLLISDANVLIDIEVGSLTSSMFSLPYQFAVPDVLFHQELQEHHSHLLQCGLVSKTLDSELIEEAYKLRQQYKRPSMNDLFALSLARYEKCRLLTGDKNLREVAESYLVDVHDTIWLVEQMIEYRKNYYRDSTNCVSENEKFRKALAVEFSRKYISTLLQS